MKLRLALAQVNPIVGDLLGNSELIRTCIAGAKSAGAQIVVFPEMVLTGYPVEDLANRPSFRAASKVAIGELASTITGEIVAFVGYLDEAKNGGPQNSVAIIHQGEIKARYVKHHLPNYGVFDEFRNFIAGDKTIVVRIHGVDVAIAICEDIWQAGGLFAQLVSRTPGLVLVPNGSPYERNKDDARLALVKKRALECKAPLAYVNMVGGQDDLIFDGDTILVNAKGEVIARSAQFEVGLMITDIDCQIGTSSPDLIISSKQVAIDNQMTGRIAARLSDDAQIWQALVIGLRDYVGKNGFKSVLIGLSGGIDSALVATIAVDALGADAVFGVALPSKYSSDHSISDAQKLAANTGLNFRTISIEPMVAAYLTNLNFVGLAEENLQARVRGTTLMGISNQEGHLVLATGNKSELAVGYSTLYGDAVGGFAPIKDIYKTDVWALARWRNAQAQIAFEVAPIPEDSIAKEPSAELRPNQKDSDSLPDYLLLDQLLRRYIDGDEGFDALRSAGFTAPLINRVIGMVDRAEYKRRQYPPGSKVSARAFGKDRRLPMTSRWQEGN